MKKFLALLLALVMTMSLVTVGASAKTAFTDDKDITEVEAVEVLSAMGVIDGYKDGSFKPKAELNRAAGAKFIAYLMLGEKKADGLVATGTLFEDVAADYALAPYVEWCAKMGIVDGYGNGKFGPKNALTQAAFGKMLLTALGYDSATEGYTGAGWQKTVYADGVAAGVYGDDGEIFAACNRETAAKMALGALLADMVCYGKTVKVFGVEKFVTETLEKYTDGKWNSTLVLPVALAENGAVTTGEKLYELYDVEYTEGTDIYGRPGHVWSYKDFEKFYMDEVVAEYTKEVSVCDLLVDLGYAKTSKTEVDVTLFEDGDSDTDTYSHKNCGGEDPVGAQGALTQVFEMDDDEYVITVINTYLAKVIDTTTAKHNKNRDDTATLDIYGVTEDVTIDTDTLKEDDMVLVNLGLENEDTIWTGDAFEYDDGEYLDVLGAADSKEGKLTGATNSTTKIDKVAYDDAAKFIHGRDDAKAAPNSGEKFVFFFDQYGNVIGCEDVETIDKYTVVDAAWTENVKGTKTAFADLVNFEGKTFVEAGELDNEVGLFKVDNEDMYDDIFTYTEDDGEYELIEAFYADVVGDHQVGRGRDSYTYRTVMNYDFDKAEINVDFYGRDRRVPADYTINMNKNTTVLVKDVNGAYDVFNGNDLKDLASFQTVAFVQDDDADYAELVYITGALYTSDSVTGFVFANADRTGFDFDWEEGFELVTVWVGTEKVVVKVDSDEMDRVTWRDGFYKFTNEVDGDGEVVVDDKDGLDWRDGYVFTRVTLAEDKGEKIEFATGDSVKVNDKLDLYLIDFDDETVTDTDYDAIAAMLDDEDVNHVGCWVVYDDDTITAVYVFAVEN